MSTVSNLTNSVRQLAAEGVSYAGAIASAAKKHGLDPKLLAAVAAQETGGPGSNSGRNIVGDGGHGHGIFQIDDRWHSFAKSAGAMDPQQNADYAAGMISGLLQKYGGDVHKALSAYNAGSPNATGTTTDWGGGKHLGYADSVLAHYAKLAGSATAQAGASNTAAGGQSELLGSMLDELLQEISQVNQLQGLAQGAPAGAPSTPAASTFTPRSFAQENQTHTSFAGFLTGDDSN